MRLTCRRIVAKTTHTLSVIRPTCLCGALLLIASWAGAAGQTTAPARPQPLSALTIVWNLAPSVQSDTITGQLAVSNNLNESLDLTVIVVAINESGKAFVLGYQHFSLAPRTFNLAIPFASSLPFGGYIVHADAIGEDANTNSIYRTLLDSSGGLTVSPP